MPALLLRCDQGPAAVPSDVVRCEGCGADCWLSQYSGPSVRALAAQTGDPRLLCGRCLATLVAIDQVFGPG